MKRFNLSLRLSSIGIALAILAPVVAAPDQTDIRRDAIVHAAEKVMPCVVNIATESVVEAHNPIEELFYGSRTHSSRVRRDHFR